MNNIKILETLTLQNGNLQITVIPTANMVISSIKYKNVETIADREGLNAYIQELKSFGIPFLAPWANRLATNEYTIGNKTVTFDPAGMKLDENNYPLHGLLTANPNWLPLDCFILSHSVSPFRIMLSAQYLAASA